MGCIIYILLKKYYFTWINCFTYIPGFIPIYFAIGSSLLIRDICFSFVILYCVIISLISLLDNIICFGTVSCLETLNNKFSIPRIVQNVLFKLILLYSSILLSFGFFNKIRPELISINVSEFLRTFS